MADSATTSSTPPPTTGQPEEEKKDAGSAGPAAPPPLQESDTLKAEAVTAAVHVPTVHVPTYLKAMLDAGSTEHVEIPVEPVSRGRVEGRGICVCCV